MKQEKIKQITAQGLSVRKYLGLEADGFKKFQGAGVNVAIIDTGIAVHDDIKSNRILEFKDFVAGKNEPYDDNGHGTFIAGIIGADGKVKGIAPKVNFVVIKAMDKSGDVDKDRLIIALEWLVENQKKYNIKVVNLSLGGSPFIKNNDDLLLKKVHELDQAGVIIVTSAGNISSRYNTILSPGTSSDVVTVGGVKNNRTYSIQDDKLASFSPEGYRQNGIIKPDIVTLGVDILSLDYKRTNSYITHSGTSVSTAIVSGAAAIMFEKYSVSSSSIKKIIINNAIKLKNESELKQGNGELHF
ncbi:S8 family serine peptidase [Cohnella faecalis]|uniref:S8 family serine peptidase n=1 Tax=Cohnella faecalis TaxID=2315694 RepID=UPI00131478F5|nr:S8 family serine peptidase [Cohnella faecalis]